MCRACSDPGGPRRCAGSSVPRRGRVRIRSEEQKAIERERARRRYRQRKADEGRGFVRDYTRVKPYLVDLTARRAPTLQATDHVQPAPALTTENIQPGAERTPRPVAFAPPQPVWGSDDDARTAELVAKVDALIADPRTAPIDEILARRMRARREGRFESPEPLIQLGTGWVSQSGTITDDCPAESRDLVQELLDSGRIRLQPVSPRAAQYGVVGEGEWVTSISQQPEVTRAQTLARQQIQADRRFADGSIDWDRVTEPQLRNLRPLIEAPEPGRIQMAPGLVRVDGTVDEARMARHPVAPVRALRERLAVAFGS